MFGFMYVCMYVYMFVLYVEVKWSMGDGVVL